VASKSSDVTLDERLREINRLLRAAIAGEPAGKLDVCSEGEMGVLEQLLTELISAASITEDKSTGNKRLDQPARLEQDTPDLVELKNQITVIKERQVQFLSAMSEDIRTPLNGVLGITQILLNMPLGGGQRDYVQIIHQSNKTLLSVINDILDYSKIEAGELELEAISFDLELACHEVAGLLQTRVREKDVELIFRYSQKLPRQFVGDPARIRQVLTNLVSNAIKYTRSGHVLIEVNLLEEKEGDPLVSIKVEDTGLGIDPATQQKIVEIFSQHEGLMQNSSDMGLGLVICKRLVDLMDGKISIESKLGQGTSFLFTLPLKRDKNREGLPLCDLSGVRVLLVEPSHIYSSVYRDYLTGFAMRPLVVASADDALVKLKKATRTNRAFQICLVADPMRNGNSMDFAAEVKASTEIEDLALVVLSSETHRGDASKFKDAGYSAYLTPPILLDSFRDTLAAALASLKMHSPAVPIITKYHAAEIDLDAGRSKVKLEGHVLLAEDIKVNQIVAKGMLRKLGLDVTTVSTGTQAVKAWSDGLYDLILMDCHMPEMDGTEATRIIRRMEREQQIESETPIIALATNMLPTNQQAYLDVGMNDCLSKPFTSGRLLELLQVHLRNQSGATSEISSLSNPDSCVDWHALKELKQSMGSQFIDMIPAFSETSEAIIGQLLIADPEDGLMTVERLANSLSSVSSGVGAVGLLSLSKMLEMQAKEGKVVALTRQVRELSDAFDKARQVLDAYHSNHQS